MANKNVCYLKQKTDLGGLEGLELIIFHLRLRLDHRAQLSDVW